MRQSASTQELVHSDAPPARVARALAFTALLAAFVTLRSALADPSGPEAAQKGFDLLTHKPFTQIVMKKSELWDIWRVWEEPARSEAEKASSDERRKLIFARYGYIERDFDTTGLPLGTTEDAEGNLVTNCFTCHGGKVAGKPIPGVGNTHVDFTTFAEDLQHYQALTSTGDGTGAAGHLSRNPSAAKLVLNSSRGVTNAFVLSVALSSLRDKEMNLTFPRMFGKWVDHDEDPPAWWTYKKKTRIYWDGFGKPNARELMQFAMTPNNSGEVFRSFEEDFNYIEAYIRNLAPPKYPYPIDQRLAEKGRELFEISCSKCHGTYGKDWTYPSKVVPIAVIGTDPVRLTALPKAWKEFFNTSWITNYGEQPFDTESTGYLAPPLDGIWASAPYFHNGSVPTLEHVMNAAARPKVWRQDEDGYDQKRVGLQVQELDQIPEDLIPIDRRRYYSIETPGHGNQGHPFPDQDLNAEEKVAVLEYLKTL